MKDIDLIAQVKKVLSEKFDGKDGVLLAIYIFGSWGSQYETNTSDVDIAILCNKKIPQVLLWDLTQSIAIQIEQDVDLLDLKSVSTVMQMQVISTGERVFCGDFQYCEKFEDIVFSSYARLNEERREILEDIQTRGSIYGG